MQGTELAGCVEEAVESTGGELLTGPSPWRSQGLGTEDGGKARHLACMLLGCLCITLFMSLWYIKRFSSYLVFHGVCPGGEILRAAVCPLWLAYSPDQPK